ncbi:cupin domain-containing protein [Fusarium circinatum]|uniref:Cupin domain-containing protein n=1 Tax=Fusarium circinatum TaxID=48490 RepID=A0A8H5X0X9_FUSCI|nr:cupin domain-containing protein [Fusarium circinatum]
MDGQRRLVASIYPRGSERRETRHSVYRIVKRLQSVNLRIMHQVRDVDHCLLVVERKLKVELEGLSSENVLHDREAVVKLASRGFKLDIASPFVKIFSVANGLGIETLIQETGKPFEGFIKPEKLDKVDSVKLTRVAKEIRATME